MSNAAKEEITQQYFSPTQAAKYTGLSTVTIHRLTRSGVLKALHIPTVEGRFYSKAELDALFVSEEETTEPQSEGTSNKRGTAGRKVRGRGRPPSSKTTSNNTNQRD